MTVWCRADDVLWRSLAGITVVRMPSGEYATLRSVAHLVWLGLEYPGDLEEVAGDIEDVLDASCSAEIAEALSDLVDMRLVIEG